MLISPSLMIDLRFDLSLYFFLLSFKVVNEKAVNEYDVEYLVEADCASASIIIGGKSTSHQNTNSWSRTTCERDMTKNICHS